MSELAPTSDGQHHLEDLGGADWQIPTASPRRPFEATGQPSPLRNGHARSLIGPPGSTPPCSQNEDSVCSHASSPDVACPSPVSSSRSRVATEASLREAHRTPKAGLTPPLAGEPSLRAHHEAGSQQGGADPQDPACRTALPSTHPVCRQPALSRAEGKEHVSREHHLEEAPRLISDGSDGEGQVRPFDVRSDHRERDL